MSKIKTEVQWYYRTALIWAVTLYCVVDRFFLLLLVHSGQCYLCLVHVLKFWSVQKRNRKMVVFCQNQNAKMAKGKIYFMRVHVLAIN